MTGQRTPSSRPRSRSTHGGPRGRGSGLSEGGLRLLRLIDRGAPQKAQADGSVQLSRMLAVPALIQDLLSSGAVCHRPDGGLALTEPGRALLARASAEGTRAAGRVERTAGRGGNDDAFRRQHQRRAMVRPVDGGAALLVNLTESPLGWLLARRKITAEQAEAGEVFRCDYEMAGLMAPVTRAYDAAPVSRATRGASREPVLADRQLDARRRVARAVDALGPGLSDVVIRVAACQEGMEAAERALGWPARSGKLVLGIALDRLMAHYAGRRYR